MSLYIENLKNLSAQNPDRGLDINTFRIMMEAMFRGKQFQTAYGAARTHYHLYGEEEPVGFIGAYYSPSEKLFQSPKDTQRDTLQNIIRSHRDTVQNALPFTMLKVEAKYDFVTGHECNYCAFGGTADFSRGFMINLGGPLADIVLFQFDPEKSRTLYDQDPNPDKHQFVTLLLNLLLVNGFNGSDSVSAKGGRIHMKKIILCDQNFTVEKIIHTYNKSYRPAGNINPLGVHISVTDESQPWNVNFDVLY
jgi:hypothetical protein